MAAAAVLSISAPAFALNAPEFQDDTKRNARIQLIYEVLTAARSYVSRSACPVARDKGGRLRLLAALMAPSSKRELVQLAARVSRAGLTICSALRRRLATLRSMLSRAQTRRPTSLSRS